MLNVKKMYKKKIASVNLNFGPQHPAAHGVLRMILTTVGDRIHESDTHIGLLHRGTEYLITTKSFYLSSPYFDRLDYVSMLIQEHAFCLAVEYNLKGFLLPVVVEKTRTTLDELTRILNHLLALACHALDVGSMSPLFWAFEERELIMNIYEYVSGARMHAAFYRPLFLNKVLGQSVLKKITDFTINFKSTLLEISEVLNQNKLWKKRLFNVGVTTKTTAKGFGLTGLFLRALGEKKDLRLLLKTSYSFYRFINFMSYSTKQGDSLNRYFLRLYETIESSNILNNVLISYFKKSETNIKDYVNMETTISKFKIWSCLIPLNKKTIFRYVESPKGFFGVFLKSYNTPTPYFCKIKSPSYNHLLWISINNKKNLLTDLVTLIGTVDIVFGEVDR